MRLFAAVVLCLAVASPSFAQDSNAKEAKRKSGTIKLWSGIGAIALGAILALDSHESASTTIPGVGTISASATNKGELATGLILAAGGGYLVWDGLNERKEADSMKSTRFVIAPLVRGVGGFVRKTW